MASYMEPKTVDETGQGSVEQYAEQAVLYMQAVTASSAPATAQSTVGTSLHETLGSGSAFRPALTADRYGFGGAPRVHNPFTH